MIIKSYSGEFRYNRNVVPNAKRSKQIEFSELDIGVGGA